MKVCGGFTEHDMTLGWRGSCACGWYGPWRDWSLMAVERDVLEHWGECGERVYGGLLDSGVPAIHAGDPRTACDGRGSDDTKPGRWCRGGRP